MTTRTVAFIQARMSSNRYPGKVLESLQGEPMIVYMVRRVQRARRLDDVVVVTSCESSDDPLVDRLVAAGIPSFRGSLDDVLKRYVDAARQHDASEIVRLTGDCPLVDPGVIDAVISARRKDGAEYASNVEPPTYPDGLDVECFTRELLERAHSHATRPPDREHVTLWMRDPANGVRRANVSAVADLSHLRLTVDYEDDMQAVRRIAANLEHVGGFDLFDMLRVVTMQPDIVNLNPHSRNEGLAKSLGQSTTPSPCGAKQ